MKKILFFLFMMLAVVTNAQTGFASLGKIHNQLVNRDLEVKALFKSGNVFCVEIECPISEYLDGTIMIKGDSLTKFIDALAKVRPAMSIYKKRVETEGYEGNIALTGFPNVTYRWGVMCSERNADFMIILCKRDDRYLAGIAREAIDGDETATFYMQFESLDEIDHLMSLLSDENISRCSNGSYFAR